MTPAELVEEVLAEVGDPGPTAIQLGVLYRLLTRSEQVVAREIGGYRYTDQTITLVSGTGSYRMPARTLLRAESVLQGTTRFVPVDRDVALQGIDEDAEGPFYYFEPPGRTAPYRSIVVVPTTYTGTLDITGTWETAALSPASPSFSIGDQFHEAIRAHLMVWLRRMAPYANGDMLLYWEEKLKREMGRAKAHVPELYPPTAGLRPYTI